MTTPSVRLHAHLQAQNSRIREQSQNVPRPSRLRFNVNTVGIGETRLTGTQAIAFNALMLEEPIFTWGVQARDHLRAEELPLATALVLTYLRNKSGLYTGATLGFRVESIRTNIRLKFSVVFEGSTLRTTAGMQNNVPAARGSNVYRGPASIDESAL